MMLLQALEETKNIFFACRAQTGGDLFQASYRISFDVIEQRLRVHVERLVSLLSPLASVNPEFVFVELAVNSGRINWPLKPNRIKRNERIILRPF